MVFSSTVFLFLFLPVVLVLNFLLPDKWKNTFLLFASLFFYAWGEKGYVLIMIVSILLNYGLGILIQQKRNPTSIGIGVFLNLALLIYYKYFGFLCTNIFSLLGLKMELEMVHLPIGISFFTFQGISYIVDVYRQDAIAEKSVVNTGLYISLFPQLIAGPIVRYNTIMDQIKSRTLTLFQFSEGTKRFIIGLAKKVIIANTLGQVADGIMDGSPDQWYSDSAWLGVVCYALQIYYDFSGYSDMAIGLGKMFGFDFQENFNFPYQSKSVQEFWRRWHISLSSWFKDYLYIPLGGNRKGARRLYVNLLIVFLLTGFWHGASWNFIVWGLFHGLFLILERVGLGSWLERTPAIFSRVYLILVVLIAWVFFRIEEIEVAWGYIIHLFAFDRFDFSLLRDNYLNNYQYLILVLGLVLSYDWRKKLRLVSARIPIVYQAVQALLLLVLLLYTSSEVANATYNPFIYFRF